MPIKYITKWNKKIYDDIIDVRSPDEYKEDHIPKSLNLPVLNNKQSLFEKGINLDKIICYY